MTDRKKPYAGFWITVALVALLVAYPLSFGPAESIIARGWVGDDVGKSLRLFYRPINWLYSNSPPPIKKAIGWYTSIW